MLRRLLKWAAWSVGVIGAIAVISVLTLNVIAERKAERIVVLTNGDVELNLETSDIGHGKYLFESRGCSQCHGETGAGKVVINDESIGLFVKSPSIAPGAGGVVGEYRTIDWVRAIRHGVKRDGTPLLVMPSEDYARFSDADLSALVAYMRSLPKVNGGPAEIRFPFLLKAMYALGAFQDAAEKIDHSRSPSPAMTPTVSTTYGEYVAQMCIGCHGPGLSGGRIPGAPPHWPAAANITPAPDGGLRHYESAEALIQMFRTGVRPDGSGVSKVMPFESLRRYSDIDIRAVFLYLNSIEPRLAGNR